MQGFLQSLRQYAVFDGRSSRAQYWSFTAHAFVLTALLAAADGVLGTMSYTFGLGWLSGLFLLAMTLPTLAVTSRRMHDAGWPGWLALLHLVPAVGSVVVSLAALRRSQPHRNAWGDPPASGSAWRALAVNAVVLAVLAGAGVAALGVLSVRTITAAVKQDGARYRSSGASFGASQPASACVDEVLRPGPEQLPMLALEEQVAKVVLARHWLAGCLAASTGEESRRRLCREVPKDPFGAGPWMAARCQPGHVGARCHGLLEETRAFCHGGPTM